MATTQSLKEKLGAGGTAQPPVVVKGKGGAVTYLAESGAQITLSPQIIRDYLVSGKKNLVTDQEIQMFLRLCQYQRLNPWLKEAYLVKYGENSPASIVVGKETFTKRADRNKQYRGNTAGVVVLTAAGELVHRPGTIVLKNEELIGGWAKVEREGRTPTEITVAMSEYEGKTFNYDTGNWETNRQWASKPGTMIRKVALVQALRETFPEDLGGMYAAEEMTELDPDLFTEDPEQDPDSQPGPGRSGKSARDIIIDVDVTDEQPEPPPLDMQDLENMVLGKVSEQPPHTCENCGNGITDRVYSFSMKKHGKSLCYKCQPKQ